MTVPHWPKVAAALETKRGLTIQELAEILGQSVDSAGEWAVRAHRRNLLWLTHRGGKGLYTHRDRLEALRAEHETEAAERKKRLKREANRRAWLRRLEAERDGFEHRHSGPGEYQQIRRPVICSVWDLAKT